ncbi:hypothetical protein AMECASPLE_022284 [Ameca splendens]|uniref:Uncharacterized protein n=1 Tax=Ameca splendens TaxID=208324 RepID=A0ABV0Z3E0_9TELE
MDILVAGAADLVETPRLPSPQTPPPAPPGGAQGVPRPAEIHSPSSVLEHLLGMVSRRHPKQMPEPPQLTSLDVEEQQLYSELLPVEEAHFSHLDLVLSVMTQSSRS